MSTLFMFIIGISYTMYKEREGIWSIFFEVTSFTFVVSRVIISSIQISVLFCQIKLDRFFLESLSLSWVGFKIPPNLPKRSFLLYAFWSLGSISIKGCICIWIYAFVGSSGVNSGTHGEIKAPSPFLRNVLSERLIS